VKLVPSFPQQQHLTWALPDPALAFQDIAEPILKNTFSPERALVPEFQTFGI